MSPPPRSRLKFVGLGWFSVVMGLTGLALAWQAAAPLLGEMATAASLVVGTLATLCFALLLIASVGRLLRHPVAVAEDLNHPVRHPFVATIPVSLLLLATWLTGLGILEGLALALWWAGSAGQLWATVWVLARWLNHTPTTPTGNGSALWAGVTPVLFIPVVGNVLAPLAGFPLGAGGWAAAQFGIGLLFWPVVLTLNLTRRLAHGSIPERLMPTWFITIAPPAVVGLALLRIETPLWIAQATWGMALISLLWVSTLAKRIAGQAFALTHWAMSFPLAAFTTLTLKLSAAQPVPFHQTIGVLLLALTSLMIVGLVLATIKGLRDGSLLAPEPVASIIPASA